MKYVRSKVISESLTLRYDNELTVKGLSDQFGDDK